VTRLVVALAVLLAQAAAPWSGARLERSGVPAVYREAWRNAPNRKTCALLAFRRAATTGAKPRRAYFGGGWGVAFDQGGVRGAFGVAWAGLAADDTAGSYHFPHAIRWADGSVAEYGPEGGTGPSQLAYLHIAGQGCLYNVWSKLGRTHLERLLGELRFVE
jgi:hypothetical protein